MRLVDFSDVPFDTAGNPTVGGLFGVWHRIAKRLIFDRRPQKATEERLGWARLPLGCRFCKLVLKPGEGIRGSGADLKSCFFQCRNAPDAVPRNAVGNSFDGGEYPEWAGIPCHKYFIAFEVLGMGDHNSVDIVQGLHVDMLTTGGGVPEDGCLEYGNPPPLSNTYFGVYIPNCYVNFLPRVRLPGPSNMQSPMLHVPGELPTSTTHLQADAEPSGLTSTRPAQGQNEGERTGVGGRCD